MPLLMSAGKGGKLRRWDSQLRPAGTIDLVSPSAPSVMTGDGRSPSLATHRRCARCRSTARAARR